MVQLLADVSTKGIESNVVTDSTAMYAQARAGPVDGKECCLEWLLGQVVQWSMRASLLATTLAQQWLDDL